MARSECSDALPGLFPFGLSAADEVRARTLHEESIIVDLAFQGVGSSIFAHYPEELISDLMVRLEKSEGDFDRLLEAGFWPYEMSRLGRSDLVLEWLRFSGITCAPFDIPVYDRKDPTWNRLVALQERYRSLPWLRFVTTAEELRLAKRERVIAFYGFWQPITPIPRSLDAIEAAYVRGLRCLMLTYNSMDNVGVGCMERVDAGLSTFGLEVMKRCNEIGIIVDASHCGELTTLDACRYSTRPVMANHTAALGLHVHPRNKSDVVLRAIASTGGVVGIAAAPFFLTDLARPTIESMLDHVDYTVSLIGWEHVAIGTDWPLQVPAEILDRMLENRASELGYRKGCRFQSSAKLAGLNDGRDLPNITRGLVARGYTDAQIVGIMGGNFLRVFGEICG